MIFSWCEAKCEQLILPGLIFHIWSISVVFYDKFDTCYKIFSMVTIGNTGMFIAVCEKIG